MNTSIRNYSSDTKCPTHKNKNGRGNKITVRTVAKAKVGDMEEEIREEFLRRFRKYMTSVVHEAVGKSIY